MTPGGIARWLETALAALVWAALVIGLAVGALTVPVYTSAAVQALKVPESAGLPIDDTVRLAGMVRSLVADPRYEPLPATWRGGPAFDESAVSHLLDVRAVLAGARGAAGACAAALALWIGAGVARRRWRALARGMRAGALVVLAGLALAVAAAALDFGTFFASFHALFFQAGTWTFPYDSMLIRLFPERFWIASGVAWGALSAAGAGALLVTARSLPVTAPLGVLAGTHVGPSQEGGSRSADNV